MSSPTFSSRFITSIDHAALCMAALFSAAALGLAYLGQYRFGLHPCELCLMQRYPYMVVAGLGVLGLFCRRQFALVTILAWAAALILLGDALLAFYHAGVERQVFPGFSACSGAATAANSLEEMRRQILSAPLVACNEIAWQFLGLSMAAWNAIMAFFASVATFVSISE